MRRLFLALCAFLFLASNAEASGRLSIHGQSEGATPPPLTQTAYFGSKTLVGNGGARPTGIVLPATAPETTSYYWEPTYQWAVPKNGAIKTYNAVRGSPLSGCEVMTVTDAIAQVFTYNLCVDNSKAGDYTIRWRNGDTQNSTSGNAQLLLAFSKLNYGETIRVRGGTTLNTILDCQTGCSPGGNTLFNGTLVYGFVCGIGNCTAGGTGFTGSNYKQILPELGTTVMIGPISFGSQTAGFTQLVGVRFADFVVDGEAATYTGYMVGCTPGSGGSGGVGAGQFLIENLTIIGNLADTYGTTRPSGILACTDANWTINNVTASYLSNGMSIAQSTGAYPADVNGTAPAGGYTVTNNIFSSISRDVIDASCIRNTTISGNLFVDKRTAVKLGSAITSPAWLNPYDSALQFHGDFFQLNGRNGGAANGCVYQFYPGIKIDSNLVLRGIGQDNLPFWSVAGGFPNPNDYSTATPTCTPWPSCKNSGIPTPAKTLPPSTADGTGSGQGIYFSNQYGNNGDQFNGSGGIVRPYALEYTGLEMQYNIVMQEFVTGFNPAEMRDVTIVGNVVIATHPPAANLYDTTWGFGLAKAQVGTSATGCVPGPCVGGHVLGTANRIDRNISGLGGNWTGQVGTVFTGANVLVDNANLAAAFQSPATSGSPRSIADYKSAYLPILNGPLEVCPNVYAGPFRPDGSPETGSCP